MITTELEDEHEQRARYADAAIDALTDAAAAGVQFAKDEAGVSGGAVESAALKDCAADLAVTIVLALRKRILTDGSGDDPIARTPPTRSGAGRASNVSVPTPRDEPLRSVWWTPRRVATYGSSSRRVTRRVTRARWTRRREGGSPVRASRAARPSHRCTPVAPAPLFLFEKRPRLVACVVRLISRHGRDDLVDSLEDSGSASLSSSSSSGSCRCVISPCSGPTRCGSPRSVSARFSRHS